MNLKNSINNSNIQKDNLKIVSNNINNTLVDLGGEKARNLLNIPEKMNGLVQNYSKYATVTLNTLIESKVMTIPYAKLAFEPTKVIISIRKYCEYGNRGYGYSTLDSVNYANMFKTISSDSIVLDGTQINNLLSFMSDTNEYPNRLIEIIFM